MVPQMKNKIGSSFIAFFFFPSGFFKMQENTFIYKSTDRNLYPCICLKTQYVNMLSETYKTSKSLRDNVRASAKALQFQYVRLEEQL